MPAFRGEIPTPEELKRLRLDAGYEQKKDWAAHLAVDPGYITKLESGEKTLKRTPLLLLLRRIRAETPEKTTDEP